MLIKSIEIQNFRRFKHYRCEFDPRFTLLVGPNGSGKTSLLAAILRGFLPFFNAIHMSLEITESDVRRVHSIDPGDASWRTPAFPAFVYSKLFIADGELTTCAYRDAASFQLVSPDPKLGPITSAAWEASNRLTSAWFDPKRTAPAPLMARFGAINAINGNGKAGVIAQPFENKSQVWKRAMADTVDVGQLAQWFQYNELRTLQEGVAPVTYRVAKDAVLSAIHAQDIKYIVRDNQLMVLHDDQGWRPFDQLSDGQRRVAAIFCELALRCASLNSQLGENCVAETPGVVTIDELDLHLHPQWQRSIIGDLCRVFPRIQFIAASHSPFLLQAAYEYGQVLDVSTGQFVSPTDRSIEDIAESVMGVPQPQRGQRFLELKERAQAFYELLESKPADKEAAESLKHKLDESLAVFADDPAAAAWLEQRRLAAGH